MTQFHWLNAFDWLSLADKAVDVSKEVCYTTYNVGTEVYDLHCVFVLVLPIVSKLHTRQKYCCIEKKNVGSVFLWFGCPAWEEYRRVLLEARADGRRAMGSSPSEKDRAQVYGALCTTRASKS